MSRQNTNDLATQAHEENRKSFADLLDSIRHAIDHDQMPKAEEILETILNKKSRNSKKEDKVARPPNSNILYTMLLNKFGFLDIIRKFCEKHKINKQNLVPISKKISKILWKDLSVEHQQFFNKLASEVSIKHREMYPNYKYKPRRKDRSGTYIPYQPKTEKTEAENEAPIHDQPVDMDMIQAYHVDETSMSNNEFTKQMNDDLSFDSQEDDSSDDEFPPKFNEERPTTPLQTNFFTETDESQNFAFVENSNNSNHTYDSSHYAYNMQ